MVALVRLNRALIKDDGIEMHTATKRAFKIMVTWYFSRKVECVSSFWSAFFVAIFLSGRLKQVFSQLRPTAGSYFDPCGGLLFGPGNLRPQICQRKLFRQGTAFIQLTKNHFGNFMNLILRFLPLLVYITFADMYCYLQ